MLTRGQVGAIVECIRTLAETAERDYGREAVVEPDVIKVVDLINGGEAFDVGYTHRRVLAAASHVLGGDRLAVLSASALGEPVYLRLGSEVIFRYEFFRWGGMGYEQWAGETATNLPRRTGLRSHL